VARIALACFDPQNAETAQAIDEVLAAVRSQPFGAKQDLAMRAGSVAKRLEEAAKKIQSEAMTRDKAQFFRAKLCAAAASEKPPLDYDSARQVAWSFMIVNHELAGKAERTSNDLIAMEFQKLDPNVLVLNPKKRGADPLATSDPKVNEVDLRYTLPPIGNYSPDEIQAAFRRIQGSLPAR
jgi:hypothetical protein